MRCDDIKRGERTVLWKGKNTSRGSSPGGRIWESEGGGRGERKRASEQESERHRVCLRVGVRVRVRVRERERSVIRFRVCDPVAQRAPLQAGLQRARPNK